MAERGLSQLKRWNAKISAYSRSIHALEQVLEGTFKGQGGREERREIGRIISKLRTARTGLEKTRDIYYAKNAKNGKHDTTNETGSQPNGAARARKWAGRFFSFLDNFGGD